MTTLLWTLIAIQIAMAAFDTIYHHELTERLAWRPSQRHELKLHAARSFVYVAVFLVLGFLEPHGAFAMLVIAALAVEVVITLADFIEEDMSRKLPASERVNHTLLAINYGAILVLAAPVLVGWAGERTAIRLVSHGYWSALMAFAGSRTSTMTSWPATVSACARRRPMKPVAPVTSTVCRGGSALTRSSGGVATASGRREASRSRRPKITAPKAAKAISALQYPCDTSLIAAGSPAHAISTGSASTRIAP